MKVLLPFGQTDSSSQVAASWAYVDTCSGWPKGFASFQSLVHASWKKKPFPGRNIRCFCANDKSSCVDLSWVAKRWISCVDLRANMMSTKVSASHPNSMQIHSKPGQMESRVDPSFNCLAFQYLQVSLGRVLRRWTMLQADLNSIVKYCW